MISALQIGDYLLGPNQPCFIIAEAGVNHNGDLSIAKQLIEEAKTANADAIKFQTFSTEALIVRDAPKARYQQVTTNVIESQYQMLEKLALRPEDFADLKSYADQLGIIFLSTPYDISSATYLKELGVAALKIASIDIVNYPFLRQVASLGLPIILSTGMATLGEIENGLAAIYSQNNDQVALLHCVTNYPIKAEEANLRVMKTLYRAFDLPVGYSDHTVGLTVALAAVALGATVIEKHFTLDRDLPGPDHITSLEPQQFAQLVMGIREVEQSLGSGVKQPLSIEIENRRAMRRSLVANCTIAQGTIITEAMLTMKRPGTGLRADFIPHIVGRKASRNIERDEQITFDLVN